MTFHFKQDGGPITGTAFLDGDELAKLRACPQCDNAPAYGADGPVTTLYYVECPQCGLRILSGVINPQSIRTLRNAVRYHKRALQQAVNHWNDRAAAKCEAPWPKMNPPLGEPPLDHIW